MIAIIPARGGSKELPGKNIKVLNGKPLIAYTIEAALQSKSLSRIIVNTDDEKIAEVAMKYGAEVPFLRPENLASDSAKTIDVLIHAINKLENDEMIDVESLMVLQPTSPLRKASHIDEAVELFFRKNADSVISYCLEAHPIKWHKYINDDGCFEDIFEESLASRQLLRKTYYPNGAIYIYKKENVLSEKLYTENSFAYIMPRKFSVDIDSIDDFNYCEYLINNNEKNN